MQKVAFTSIASTQINAVDERNDTWCVQQSKASLHDL